MAASILKIASSCSRMKICCFRGPGLNRITPKLILPVCGSGVTVNQKSILHTSETNKEQQQLFKVEKNRKEGAKHWYNERVVAVALLAMIPAACVYPNAILDHGFAVLAPLHTYWGVNAIIGDYCWRPIVPALKVIWIATSLVTMVGLFYINFNDIGVTKLFAQIITL